MQHPNLQHPQGIAQFLEHAIVHAHELTWSVGIRSFFGLPLSFYSPFEAVANFGLLDLVQYWNRTLKSEVLGEWEALSRTAKVRWAEREGHDWLSLQHDGVVIALRRGVSADEARTQLQLVSGAALGYQMPVEIKQMKTDAAAPAPVVEPAQGRSFGGGGGGGGGVGGPRAPPCRPCGC